ncbi:hypothetical protein EUBG_00974 [Escherichia coli O104:H4 str. C236-11]|nr:hypothetical protein EUBG_00974 [Escherichia coli O104:H4 str. C236-11]
MATVNGNLTGWMSLSRKPQSDLVRLGRRPADHDTERPGAAIQTIYQPGSFTPLIRVETATGEQAKTQAPQPGGYPSAVRRRRRWQCGVPPVPGADASTGWKVKSWLDRVSEGKPPLAGIVRPDGGADAKPDGPGVHAGAKNPPVPTATIAGLPLALISHGRGNSVVRRI